MAKEIKFNVKLTVDGKEQLVTATTSVRNLRELMDGAKTSADRFRASLIKMNQIELVAQNATSALQGFADGLNTLTQESRSYSAAMTAANTMAGKGAEDFSRLKEQVTDLSKTVPVARDQLANGLYQVISNGVPENNWIEYLQASARASVGGIADLGEVVKVTSTVIKNYGLQWQDAEGIQDKIQLTAKNGVTTFEQLAQALPRVTGSAAALGVSVDELMASFATLTGVSGNTAEVATQMQAIFTALVKPSAEAAKMAQQMGIQFDASAVKAAGGLQNFLTSLQQSVRQYSASSGVLEQEVYGRLFGSAEALRALIPLNGELAQTFAKNVDNMRDSAGTMDDAFSTMSGTGSAQLQMLKNKYAEMFDYIAGAAKTIQPYLNFGAQLGMSLTAVISLSNAVKSLFTSHIALSAATKASAAANAVWTASGMAADTIMKMLGISSAGAAAGVTTLKLAIRGLLIATGVGVAIAALTTGIELLMNAMEGSNRAADEATQSSEAAKAARQAEAEQISRTRSELAQNIAKLKEFKGSKEQERALVQQMNSTYGQSMGYYSTVSQWYTALTRNSKAYCDQMVNEVKIRQLANDIADIDKRRDNITHDQNGRTRRYSKQRQRRRVAVGQTDAGDGKIIPIYKTEEVAGSSPLEKAQGSFDSLTRQRNRKQRQMESLARRNSSVGYGRYDGYSATPPSAPASTPAPRPTVTPRRTTGGRNTPTNTSTDTDRKALEGSIDWYEQQLSELQKKIQSTADKGAAKTLQGQYDQMSDKLKDLKVEIGIDKPQPKEVKTAIEQLQDDLQGAQAELENAVTVEAKVKAAAKVQDIQRQIDESTKGKVTITAETEPGYVTQGSTADKRQSHANAESRIGTIKQDYEIGIIGKDEAERQIEELNSQLQQLGMKPIEVKLEESGFDKAFADIQQGWGSVQDVGNGIQGISDALDGNKNAWQAISGVISSVLQVAQGIQGIVSLIDTLTASTTANTAATTANATASAANAMAKGGEALGNAAASGAKLPFPANIAAIAAGVAAVLAVIATITSVVGSFATGGIVGGNSPTGDRLIARVNSGEMILNKSQQQRLLALLSGAVQPVTLPQRTMQPVTLDVASLGSMIDRRPVQIHGDFRLQGKDLVASASNYTRIAGKSGRRTYLG